MTASPPASPPWRARTCWCCSSDIDGLYTAPPAKAPAASHIPVVPRITAEIEAMAGGAASHLSRGGMTTKIEAGKIAVGGGAHMLIADGRVKNPLGAVAAGARCTWFLTPSKSRRRPKELDRRPARTQGVIPCRRRSGRRAGAGREPAARGRDADRGAPSSAATPVIIRDAPGSELGRGLVAYDAEEARLIVGRPSREIEAVLRPSGRAEMIHRDDMALMMGLRTPGSSQIPPWTPL